MLFVSCSQPIQPVAVQTKTEVITVPKSMFYSPKQVEAPDLRFGTCLDVLVPALRGEIDSVNKTNQEIWDWQQKQVNKYKAQY